MYMKKSWNYHFKWPGPLSYIFRYDTCLCINCLEHQVEGKSEESEGLVKFMISSKNLMYRKAHKSKDTLING